MKESEKLLVDTFRLSHAVSTSQDKYSGIHAELEVSEKLARQKFKQTKSLKDKKAVIRAILARAMLCKLVHHNMAGYQHQMFAVLPKFINSNSEEFISPEVITEYALSLVKD
jgi:hypothetical protein